MFNSSDVFLLLKLKEAGWVDTWVIGAFLFFNLIYAICAFPLGMLADKIGLKTTFIFGLTMFAIVYLGMSFGSGFGVYLALFAIYGIYSAATQGIAKAWISNIAAKQDTATAIGFFSGFESICAFIASSMTGLIWYAFGSDIAFMATALVTIGVIIYFLWIKTEVEKAETSDGLTGAAA
jgi:MFS family permease